MYTHKHTRISGKINLKRIRSWEVIRNILSVGQEIPSYSLSKVLRVVLFKFSLRNDNLALYAMIATQLFQDTCSNLWMPLLREQNAVCFTNSFKVSLVLHGVFYYLNACVLLLRRSLTDLRATEAREAIPASWTRCCTPRAPQVSGKALSWRARTGIDGRVWKKTNRDVISREPAVTHSSSQAH